MNINSAFPSNYLKAADLHGGRVTVTIASVIMEDIGGEDKPVVYFQGKQKGVILNKTNANMIAEIAKTEETDEWTGVRVVLYSARVDFQGRRVDAIRIDAPNSANGHAPAPSRQAQPKPEPARDPFYDAPPPDDDNVPF